MEQTELELLKLRKRIAELEVRLEHGTVIQENLKKEIQEIDLQLERQPPEETSND